MAKEFGEFEVQVNDPYPPRPFSVFEIYPRNLQPFICGEIYGSDRQAPTPYYSVRWPTVVDVNKFLEVVSQLNISIDENDPLNGSGWKDARELNEEEFKQYERRGIIVYTEQGIACGSLDLGLKDTNDFAPEVLQSELSVLLNHGDPVTFNHYWINTVAGDFYFDLVPSEDETIRYCGAISQFDLSTELTRLVVATSDLEVDSNFLQASFQSVLGGLPCKNPSCI